MFYCLHDDCLDALDVFATEAALREHVASRHGAAGILQRPRPGRHAGYWPKKTCAWCGDQFHSRNRLFGHLPVCPIGDGEDGATLHLTAANPFLRFEGGEQRTATRLLADMGHASPLGVTNVLTAEECRWLIDMAEARGLDRRIRSAFRVTDRVELVLPAVAQCLMRRLFEGLHLDVVVGDADVARREGVRSDIEAGLWRPTAVSDYFRICRYGSGGFFDAHFDGPKDRGEQRSIKTVMVYLNTGYRGGATTFYDSRQQHYVEGRPDYVTAEYKADTGSALVFNQRITHAGSALTHGVKYILRTELRYTWQGGAGEGSGI